MRFFSLSSKSRSWRRFLKADLMTGRLLDMDEDVPELLAAAEVASSTIRDLISDLRTSALGAGGLVEAIEHLIRRTEEHNAPAIRLNVRPVTLEAAAELTFYQIAKEALSNSVQHSGATEIVVEL